MNIIQEHELHVSSHVTHTFLRSDCSSVSWMIMFEYFIENVGLKIKIVEISQLEITFWKFQRRKSNPYKFKVKFQCYNFINKYSVVVKFQS